MAEGKIVFRMDRGELGDIIAEAPEDMTIKQATKILQGNPKAIRQMHNQVLRDLEKPNTINDSQNHKIEAELEVSTRFKKIFNQDRLNERYKK